MKNEFAKFPVAHPVFDKRKLNRTGQTGTGRDTTAAGGVWYEQSVYYYWWEFLRLSDRYKTICEGGKGRLARLYEDFGNVHAYDSFRDWWMETEGFQRNRGASLFGSMEYERVRRVTATDIEDDENTLYLAIPLNLPISTITKTARMIIGQNHTGQRGRRTRTAKGEYRYEPLTDQYSYLQKALDIYKLKQKHEDKPNWWIGNQAGYSSTNLDDENIEGKDPKASLASDTSRTLKDACSFIEGVEEGKFPVTARMRTAVKKQRKIP